MRTPNGLLYLQTSNKILYNLTALPFNSRYLASFMGILRHQNIRSNKNIIIIIINYATKILNTETDSKCRLCQQFDETIDHIISACPILAKEEYIKRHDRVCAQLHFNICKEAGVKLDKKH